MVVCQRAGCGTALRIRPIHHAPEELHLARASSAGLDEPRGGRVRPASSAHAAPARPPPAPPHMLAQQVTRELGRLHRPGEARSRVEGRDAAAAATHCALSRAAARAGARVRPRAGSQAAAVAVRPTCRPVDRRRRGDESVSPSNSTTTTTTTRDDGSPRSQLVARCRLAHASPLSTVWSSPSPSWLSTETERPLSPGEARDRGKGDAFLDRRGSKATEELDTGRESTDERRREPAQSPSESAPTRGARSVLEPASPARPQ